MKTLLIILFSIVLSLGASAQRKGVYHHVYRPRVVVVPSVGFGFGYGYPLYGYPYYGYPYYGYPNPYEYRRMPYKLSLQIQSIKMDYRNQIKDARHNKSLSHSQKREEIRTLKNERDQAIIKAQQDFRNGNMNNQNRGRNNNGYQAPGKQGRGADNKFQDNGNSSSEGNP